MSELTNCQQYNEARDYAQLRAELAAAQAGKDEALQIACDYARNYEEERFISGEEALAIQPHASVVAKIKADAVRTIADKAGNSGCVHRDFVLQLADRIEREVR